MTQINFMQQLYSAFLDSDILLSDSREVAKEVALGKKVMFVALKGDRFDANEFVEGAIDSGALYIITSRKDLANSDNIFYAEDTLDMLQQLAAYHRSKLDCKIVAITGSNGKTTTKELTVAILSKEFNVAYTKGNFNNHIGVPLTLLSISSNDQIAVVEHGANHVGEIAKLTTLSHPDVGLITNIGRAHIGEFNGVEGIVKAKGELYDFLMQRGGVVLVNMSLDYLPQMVTERGDKGMNVVSYDMTDFEELIDQGEYLSYRWSDQIVVTNLIGSYNLYNIAAATSIAKYFGVDDDTIANAIRSYKPQNMRSQLTITARNSVVVDAYNANPSSMIVSIDNFESRSPGGVYILGDMRELGSFSDAEHDLLANRLSKINDAKIILVGSYFEKAAKSHNLLWFNKVDELIDSKILNDITGSTILLKGSRSNAMERCLDYL